MKIPITLLFVFMLLSCSEDDPIVGENHTKPGTVCSSQESDEFELLNVTIEEAMIKIEVSYAGGCEEHEFCIDWPDAITAIYPPDFAVILNHDANEDGCEALITETIIFNPDDSDLGLSAEAINDMRITVVNGSDPSQTVSNR